MIQLLESSDLKLAALVQLIVEEASPRRVVLFGSRARGDARDDSDYDLMVEIDGDRDRGAVRKAILDALWGRGWRADINVRTSAAFERARDDVGFIAYQIARDGVVLYARDAGAQRLDRTAADRVREVDRPPRSVTVWLRRALHDYLAVASTLAATDEIPDVICFHAHQSAEKLLKAVIVSTRTVPPRTHDLEQLRAGCPAVIKDDTLVREACATLQGLYPKSRYPDEEEEQEEEPTIEEARAAAAAATIIRERVLSVYGERLKR